MSLTLNYGSGVQYDALGNLTNDGVGNAYTYDAESRLIKVVNLSGTFNYAYDAEGRRVSNGTYEFLYDLSGRAVTQFLTSNGVPSHEMIYAGGRHLATYSAAVTSFMHADWLGTKRLMTTMAGTNAVTCTGLPFGDGLNCQGNDRDLNEFTGDIHDSESNTEHTWFRQMSAIEGRWLRPDPYLGSINLTNPQSLNRYGYVINNPLSFIDPLGLNCTGSQTVVVTPRGTTFGSVIISDCVPPGGAGGDPGNGIPLIFKPDGQGGTGGGDDNSTAANNGKPQQPQPSPQSGSEDHCKDFTRLADTLAVTAGANGLAATGFALAAPETGGATLVVTGVFGVVAAAEALGAGALAFYADVICH